MERRIELSYEVFVGARFMAEVCGPEEVVLDVALERVRRVMGCM